MDLDRLRGYLTSCSSLLGVSGDSAKAPTLFDRAEISRKKDFQVVTFKRIVYIRIDLWNWVSYLNISSNCVTIIQVDYWIHIPIYQPLCILHSGNISVFQISEYEKISVKYAVKVLFSAIMKLFLEVLTFCSLDFIFEDVYITFQVLKHH